MCSRAATLAFARQVVLTKAKGAANLFALLSSGVWFHGRREKEEEEGWQLRTGVS